MPRLREALDKYEAKILAPYARFSAQSRGRTHDETLDPPRPNFQRDRDRVLHSRAFRRLELKTFLFLGTENRSRLTYATQAAGLARTIARHLALNEDLTEAITLARALGYPPFGPTGQRALDQLMQPHGGFDPLTQSHRILTETETRYPEFNGLNLCAEVNEALLGENSLEAQAAVLGERLAQVCYGFEDGLEAEFFTEETLQDLPLWNQIDHQVRQHYAQLDSERRRYYVLRCLMLDLIEDIVAQTKTTLDAQPELAFSSNLGAQVAAAETFLQKNLLEHPATLAQREKSVRCLQELFHILLSHPHLLIPPFCHRIKKDGLPRATCDYLVWMTDRVAWQEFEKYVSPSTTGPLTDLQQSSLL